MRIVLAAADFSSEITTAVMWLNKRDLDITCIRLKPYVMDGKVLIDATQIIPLPEAAEYEVKIRAQAQETRKAQTTREEGFRRFWAQFVERSKNANTSLFAGRSTTKDQWIAVGMGKAGFSLGASLTETRGRVECFIRDDAEKDREKAKKWGKAVFQKLEEQKDKIEADFGAPLNWERLPERIGARIGWGFDCNWRMDEQKWPEIQDRMIDAVMRLEKAIRNPIDQLNI